MARNSKEETKQSKIKNETKRLNAIYGDIEEKRNSTIQGLIQRAAFMRATLDELEMDLIENGVVEMFSQGDQEPYERKRPTADIYNQMNNSYQKIIKQLTDLLPKEVVKADDDDGMDDFINGREDV